MNIRASLRPGGIAVVLIHKACILGSHLFGGRGYRQNLVISRGLRISQFSGDLNVSGDLISMGGPQTPVGTQV